LKYLLAPLIGIELVLGAGIELQERAKCYRDADYIKRNLAPNAVYMPLRYGFGGMCLPQNLDGPYNVDIDENGTFEAVGRVRNTENGNFEPGLFEIRDGHQVTRRFRLVNGEIEYIR